MASTARIDPRLERSAGELLGDEITELCGYIYAATHHLLELNLSASSMNRSTGPSSASSPAPTG
jgi:hypothetical protein